MSKRVSHSSIAINVWVKGFISKGIHDISDFGINVHIFVLFEFQDCPVGPNFQQAFNH